MTLVYDERITTRFFAKTRRDDETGCLLWTAGTGRFGYGRFAIRGINCRAHRVAWEMENGPIPPGGLVLHTCDTPPCVEARHLYLGDHGDNERDAVSRNRHGNKKKTRCSMGHTFSESNTYRYGTHRGCRICRARRSVAATKAQRARQGREDKGHV